MQHGFNNSTRFTRFVNCQESLYKRTAADEFSFEGNNKIICPVFYVSKKLK